MSLCELAGVFHVAIRMASVLSFRYALIQQISTKFNIIVSTRAYGASVETTVACVK